MKASTINYTMQCSEGTRHTAYDIHDVTVEKATKPGILDEIVIDIKLTEEAQKKVAHNMLYSNKYGYKDATDLIRLVIREANGAFDLITAYPIRNTGYTHPRKETKEDIYTMYKDYFFPENVKNTINQETKTYIVNYK